jgi:hypothetical protein
VQPGDVRVVERDVGVGGAADLDTAAVQQMDPARVRSGDHVEAGRGVVHLGVRLGVGGGAEGQHRAVGQRRLAEGAALGVEPLGTGVQHGLAGAGSAVAADRGGERGGYRRQGRPRRGRDQYVAARGAAPGRLGGRGQRVYDGQPDLHRRQRSLLPGRGQSPTPHEHIGQYCRHPRTCH